jgi:hypothetical protein
MDSETRNKSKVLESSGAHCPADASRTDRHPGRAATGLQARRKEIRVVERCCPESPSPDLPDQNRRTRALTGAGLEVLLKLSKQCIAFAIRNRGPILNEAVEFGLQSEGATLGNPVGRTTPPRTLEPPTEPVPASRLELASPSKAPPTSSCAPDASSIAMAPSTLISAVIGENDLDECEALLRGAIEMVRGSTRSSQRAAGVTNAESKPELKGSMRAEGASTSRVVVQIYYDAHKAKYAAKDSRSGLNVLRHEDRARLRAMCDRMGWHAVETV